MAHYEDCHQCGNDEKGTIIIECSDCGGLFCNDCAKKAEIDDAIENPDSFFDNILRSNSILAKCPHCLIFGNHIIKYRIGEDEDEDD